MCQFPLFETLAIIDGEIQNISYHQKRIDNAFTYYFKRNPKWDLSKIIQVKDEYTKGLIRCRIDYNETTYQINFYPYQPRKIKTFQCVYVENIDYQFKYSNRIALDKLKTENTDEIIIIHRGFVSDCTIGNLLFLKQGKWYSPNHYLLKGTQLTRLLEEQKVSLTDIRAEDLFDYEQIMLINALNPFDPARAISIASGQILK
ncbi:MULTISPECIES: aminotransferase class IV family protein [Glaesserella]|uniref:Branched-chain amino acid aminotransferase n=1 Tax=Glaesserella australis TaxID=2094024 RepID=A0A328C0S4_9PAST|nr:MULTISPECIES: aminotransferase class IV family protein [Glaesserella]AUI66335.1 branched-chain amino acid aminotransferase [Glaesserella sp. 15-184]RAL19451.1 branched-chain amino acid aminotransferase [Glaesserella australis]